MEAYYLFLKPGEKPQLFNGIKLDTIEGKPAIKLPLIEGVPARKTRIFLDNRRPAEVKNGKIHSIFFKLYAGAKFSDPNSYVTAMSPTQDNGNAVVMTCKRWPEIKLEILSGTPNGFIPGAQILNPMDSIAFMWENERYILYNTVGEITLSTPNQKTKVTETNHAMEAAFKKVGVTV
jgi:hypothetical protein